MEWTTDWGLRGRMALTMGLLLVLYVVFASALFAYFRSTLVMVVVLGGFLGAQYFLGDRLALRSMGARTVEESEYPELHAAVGRLAQQADLPKPEVAVADDPVPTAFATGRSKAHATVCVSTGLVETLTREELAGVIAHELAHIKNRDMAVMTVAGFLSTLAFLIVRWGWLFGGRSRNQAPVWVAVVVSLVVGVLSFLLVRALSRYREYAADRGGAAITGRPSALASALLKITGRMDRIPDRDLREEADMNAFFIVPVEAGVLARLLRTHPPTDRRVERLRELEREMEAA